MQRSDFGALDEDGRGELEEVLVVPGALLVHGRAVRAVRAVHLHREGPRDVLKRLQLERRARHAMLRDGGERQRQLSCGARRAGEEVQEGVRGAALLGLRHGHTQLVLRLAQPVHIVVHAGAQRVQRVLDVALWAHRHLEIAHQLLVQDVGEVLPSVVGVVVAVPHHEEGIPPAPVPPGDDAGRLILVPVLVDLGPAVGLWGGCW